MIERSHVFTIRIVLKDFSAVQVVAGMVRLIQIAENIDG